MEETKRICLWSGPRNISTTMMYSFAQRPDTIVYDEPLYGYFLNNHEARYYHPGAEDTLAEMETDGEKVVDMMLGAQPKPVVFYKQMTHHLLDLDRSFMRHTINLILTRDPREMLLSYIKQIENPTMDDVGYEQHIDLIQYLRSIGQEPIVLESRKILENPRVVLSKLCEKIGIPFYEEMLSWPQGARPEDGSWEKYWYKSVHASTGFMPYVPKNEPVPERLRPLLDDCLKCYEQLVPLALSAP